MRSRTPCKTHLSKYFNNNFNFTGLIIGDDLVNAKDPGVMDEMQRKKERIMLQSLRRKQQGEENRLRKLEEERLKKEAEAAKEEERNRKKEEEKARKEAILEQHKLKKEMDRAEEEVHYLNIISILSIAHLISFRSFIRLYNGNSYLLLINNNVAL